ncbi:alkaline phosphatase family protein [Actinosynnema sp. NPDC020468]|uniref:alkaline phosphatase family protein n=1 Tax=Actinosynnema sp. NPDC020468 TaxID=3154488 RepID=UPI0033D8B9A9
MESEGSWELPSRGAGTLADVVPALLHRMGVPDEVDVVGMPEVARACVLLVDGLGWELLRRHEEDAPFLASLARGRAPIASGFPSTTAAGITSLGTGSPSGEHGLVGYTFEVGHDELLDTLGWRRHGGGEDLRDRYRPEDVQPRVTAWERAARAGIAVRAVAPHPQRGSGLSRAALRGADFRGVLGFGDLVSGVTEALRPDRALCYAYHADLDSLGHVHGPGSDPWRLQLTHVDHVAASIASRLPAGAALVVTADHGMVRIADPVDFDTTPELRDGVRLLGGEPRVRHVYAEPGATRSVLDAWREVLDDRAWILSRDAAINAGWFGAHVPDAHRSRIGDLVVAARGTSAVVRTTAEPRASAFPGHHGSLDRDEQLVPLLVFRAP